MEPTIFMAWLSDTEGSGGWWTPEDREEAHCAKWSPRAPRHLSFHTSREGAEAALIAAAKEAWEADECSYSHGAWGGDERADNSDAAMLRYMNRHAGYEAHVTEQPVHFAEVPVTGVTATVDAQVRAAEPEPPEGFRVCHHTVAEGCTGHGDF